MTINPVFTIFESVPRQGAGDDEHTAKAYSLIIEPPGGGCEILDIGCGKGYRRWLLPGCAPPA